MEYRHKSVLFFYPEGSGIFKTYTLILPGIKKDRMAAVECVVKYIQKNFLKFVEKAIDF